MSNPDLRETIAQLEERRAECARAAEQLTAEADALALDAEFDADKAKRRDQLRRKADAERQRLGDITKAVAQASARLSDERAEESRAHRAEKVEEAIALAREVEVTGAELEEHLAAVEKAYGRLDAQRKRLHDTLVAADLRAVAHWLLDRPSGVTVRDLVIFSSPKVARDLRIVRPAGYKSGRLGALSKLRSIDYDSWRRPRPERKAS